MARLELEEETGYVAQIVEKLVGEFNPFNGVTDEIAKCSVACGLSFFIKARPEADRRI